jgi:hypothetical protein
MSGALWIGLLLLCTILLFEIVAPQKITEGFLVPVLSSRPSYFSQFVPKRGDVGPFKEQAGYTLDARYFSGYTDVQRYGVNQDYCRMVVPTGGTPEKTFFACALGGTGEVSSVEFRTNTVEQGFNLSRDDYMNDIMKDGRSAYCRILKGDDGTFQPLCRRAQDMSFSERDEADGNPPDDIVKLLSFYDGCVVWLRLRDDILDYVNSVQIYTAGSINIDETPRPSVTRGLTFDGIHQFMRIGDSPDLTLGDKVKLRTVRTFSLWVFIDEFTNNSHFFDFGDGPAKNNVFLGILGKGDPSVSSGDIRPLLCGGETTLPSGPSGAQTAAEVTPQEFMKTTAANVDEYVNIDQEVEARRLPPSTVRPAQVPSGAADKATLLYEVWDQRQRKMRIRVNSIIPLKKWTHITVTALTNDAARPDIAVYVNGEQVFIQPSGFLPQATSTSKNYLGKSNWTDADSTYELRDELFSGSLFDFRMYNTPMSQKKIKDIIGWGKGLLAIA